MSKWPVEGVKSCIIDPPWSYEQYHDAANGAAKSSYECSATEEIARIPVGEMLAPKAVVALWTTGPMLAQGEAHKLLRAWGLTGKTLIPWLKNSPTSTDLATGVGIWFQANAEYVIFAVKGSSPGDFASRRGRLGVLVGDREDPDFWARVSERDAILAPKAKKHSEKPWTLHEYMETFEGGPKVELFARREREGWTCLGDELGWYLGEWGAAQL